MTSLDDAPELLPYRGQPTQLAAGGPGKRPSLRLRFERRAGRSTLTEAASEAPLTASPAVYWDEAMPDLPGVFIVSTSGGILQGDRLALEIAVGPGARAHVTTQAATKIHAMDANYASQSQSIRLEEGAYLEYLPDLVIPFRHARFVSRTRISIAPTATLLYSEILMPGRTHHGAGEAFAYDLLSWAVGAERPDGTELFADKLVIEPGRTDVRRAGVMGGLDVFGTVFLLTPEAHADRVFAKVPAAVDVAGGWAAGASRLPNRAGLVYKIAGADSRRVRDKLREFWSVVRLEVAGAPLSDTTRWR